MGTGKNGILTKESECGIITLLVKPSTLQEWGASALAKNLEISLLLDFYGSMLTEKKREVISCYYNDDLSLSEIAQNEGITRQGVRDSIKRGEAQLLDMEQNLGLLRKSRERAEAYAAIRQFAEHIRDYNSRFVYDKSITEQIENLLKILGKLENSD